MMILLLLSFLSFILPPSRTSYLPFFYLSLPSFPLLLASPQAPFMSAAAAADNTVGVPPISFILLSSHMNCLHLFPLLLPLTFRLLSFFFMLPLLAIRLLFAILECSALVV